MLLDWLQASEHWPTLIEMAGSCPNVSVKVSGWFRHGSEQCGPATLELLEAYGADRLMFGTDFPWVMGDGQDGYVPQWKVWDTWANSYANSTCLEEL